MRPCGRKAKTSTMHNRFGQDRERFLGGTYETETKKQKQDTLSHATTGNFHSSSQASSFWRFGHGTIHHTHKRTRTPPRAHQLVQCVPSTVRYGGSKYQFVEHEYFGAPSAMTTCHQPAGKNNTSAGPRRASSNRKLVEVVRRRSGQDHSSFADTPPGSASKRCRGCARRNVRVPARHAYTLSNRSRWHWVTVGPTDTNNWCRRGCHGNAASQRSTAGPWMC